MIGIWERLRGRGEWAYRHSLCPFTYAARDVFGPTHTIRLKKSPDVARNAEVEPFSKGQRYRIETSTCGSQRCSICSKSHPTCPYSPQIAGVFERFRRGERGNQCLSAPLPMNAPITTENEGVGLEFKAGAEGDEGSSDVDVLPRLAGLRGVLAYGHVPTFLAPPIYLGSRTTRCISCERWRTIPPWGR